MGAALPLCTTTSMMTNGAPGKAPGPVPLIAADFAEGGHLQAQMGGHDGYVARAARSQGQIGHALQVLGLNFQLLYADGIVRQNVAEDNDHGAPSYELRITNYE